jgi:hypothetical protein
MIGGFHLLRGAVRTSLLALIVMIGAAATASAQSSSLTALAQDAQRLAQAARRVVVSDGAFRTQMPAATAPHATGWPMATVPARGLKAGVDPTVAEFRVRSWEEGAGVRVLVFAVIASGPELEVREEQIASVLVPIDQSVEIAATEKYNASRISLTAYIDQIRRPRYSVETPHIDIPVRPWAPPQRPR